MNLEILLHKKFDVGINEMFYNKAKQTTNKLDTTGISSKKLRSVEHKLKNGWKFCEICNKLHNKKYCCSKECFQIYLKDINNPYSKFLSEKRKEYIIKNYEKICKINKNISKKVNQIKKGKKISNTKKINNSGNNGSSQSKIYIFNEKDELIFIKPKEISLKEWVNNNTPTFGQIQNSYLNGAKMSGKFLHWYAKKE